VKQRGGRERKWGGGQGREIDGERTVGSIGKSRSARRRDQALQGESERMTGSQGEGGKSWGEGGPPEGEVSSLGGTALELAVGVVGKEGGLRSLDCRSQPSCGMSEWNGKPRKGRKRGKINRKQIGCGERARHKKATGSDITKKKKGESVMHVTYRSWRRGRGRAEDHRPNQ